MSARDSLAVGLEDLLADMHHAQRDGDLGRLALVAFCDARPLGAAGRRDATWPSSPSGSSPPAPSTAARPSSPASRRFIAGLERAPRALRAPIQPPAA
jgi:hypothetical protein